MTRFNFLALALTFLSISALSAQSQHLSKLAFYENVEAAIEIVEPSAAVGTIPQGVPVTHTFTVKNTGSEPLILIDVTKPCGCQQATWTKEPIMPGKTGSVEATYNAAKVGKFTKAFTVKHNGSGKSLQLVMTGVVKQLDVVDEAEKEKAGTM